MFFFKYDETPEPGDLIEVFRVGYQHWAVYVGDGLVVHLAPPSEVADTGASSMMSLICERAMVKKDNLWDVVGNDRWTINNTLDKKYKPHSAGTIVKEACAFVGQELPYCLFRLNCEHFVTELRYGKPESRQVCKAQEAVMAVGAFAVVSFGIVALAGALFGGSRREKEDKQ
uniref:LRAT domain-containing protein n=1 Tax=Mola mola TaxID=94237 RepID=A0A3Q3VP31_MOLML